MRSGKKKLKLFIKKDNTITVSTLADNYISGNNMIRKLSLQIL